MAQILNYSETLLIWPPSGHKFRGPITEVVILMDTLQYSRNELMGKRLGPVICGCYSKVVLLLRWLPSEVSL